MNLSLEAASLNPPSSIFSMQGILAVKIDRWAPAAAPLGMGIARRSTSFSLSPSTTETRESLGSLPWMSIFSRNCAHALFDTAFLWKHGPSKTANMQCLLLLLSFGCLLGVTLFAFSKARVRTKPVPTYAGNTN